MAGVFEMAIEILKKNGYEVVVLDKDIRLVTVYRRDLPPRGVSGVLGFKGFYRGYICHGMEYDMHQHHHIDGEIRMCKNGMHYCMDPYDVLRYYDVCRINDVDFAIILDTEPKNWLHIQEAYEPTKRVTSDLFLLHGLRMSERVACLRMSERRGILNAIYGHEGSIHFSIAPSGTIYRFLA